MANPWDEKWERGERLGKGGQGETYFLTSRTTADLRGVLKCLNNNRSPQSRARMRREVVNLQTLATSGARVPRVLDHNTDLFEDVQTRLYVVMEHVSGKNLREYVEQNRPLRLERAREFVLALCKTVDIAHRDGILHRDLKPENIIVRDAERHELFIVDYGLSFNADDENLTETDETFRNRFLDLPETNTPGGNRRDARSDLTALCGVFYFCLTGHVPGQLQDGSGLLPHKREGYSIREALGDDPTVPLFEVFFTRGFAPNIANRFQSVEDLRRALSSISALGANDSDPIALAERLSTEVRERDRVTQIAEFRTAASPLFKYLERLCQQYAKKLSSFELVLTHWSLPKEINLPDGLDFVVAAPLCHKLTLSHHTFHRCHHYIVASRGEDCVLLVADSQATEAHPRVLRLTEWRQIAWYTGSPESVFELVTNEFRQWLTTSMQHLRDRVIGS